MVVKLFVFLSSSYKSDSENSSPYPDRRLSITVYSYYSGTESSLVFEEREESKKYKQLPVLPVVTNGGQETKRALQVSILSFTNVSEIRLRPLSYSPLLFLNFTFLDTIKSTGSFLHSSERSSW